MWKRISIGGIRNERRTIEVDVTICIPTKNGGEQLDQVLSAIFRQKTDLEYEVICVDSGSVDGTLDVIRKYPKVKLHQIPAEWFGHGITRNLGASLGTGEFIYFLTQDALPASDEMLDQMIKAIRRDPKCVLGFGIHYPYPDCNLLDERDLTNHFKGFGSDNTYYWIKDPERYAREEGYRHLLAFSSDNNACLRRSVFEKYPYPAVEFAEDQVWTKQMMELGYHKVFCPYAPVYHSHNYPLKQYSKRYFDEYKGLRELHGYRIVPAARKIPRATLALIKSDLKYIKSTKLSFFKKVYWANYAIRRDTKRHVFGYLGGKYADCPPDMQELMDELFSQQYQQRNRKNKKEKKHMLKKYWAFFKKGIRYLKQNHGVPDSIVQEMNAPSQVHVEKVFGFTINSETFPFKEKEYKAAQDGPIILNWVIPEMGKGSGGHINIFRFVSGLQKKGIRNRIYVETPVNFNSDKELRDFLKENYPILDPEIEVYFTTDGMDFCHGIVATSWSTAYYVRRFDNTISKFYFVQDYESYFFAVGSEAMLSENTYRFGFRGLTAGDWLKNKLEKEFGMKCDSFRFSYDRDLYHPIEKRDDKKRLFFYARPVTPRRGFELGMLALMELYRRIPEIEVIFAGWDVGNYYIPFVHLNAGSVPLDQLADLYAQCDICLIMSLTNLSLLPLEVMASNSVVATQGTENNSWLIDESNSIVIDSDPVHIADKLEYYLNHKDELANLRKKGLECAAATDWSTEIDKVYKSITEGIKEDEQKR